MGINTKLPLRQQAYAYNQPVAIQTYLGEMLQELRDIKNELKLFKDALDKPTGKETETTQKTGKPGRPKKTQD